MSDRAKDFLRQCAATAIHDEGYVRVDQPDPRPPPLVACCIEDAAAAGMTRTRLGHAVSDLRGAPSLAAFIAIEIDVRAQMHQRTLAAARL